MKTIQETRFECLKLANILATTKIIERNEVLATAESYYDWVTKMPDRASEPVLMPKDMFEIMKRTY